MSRVWCGLARVVRLARAVWVLSGRCVREGGGVGGEVVHAHSLALLPRLTLSPT